MTVWPSLVGSDEVGWGDVSRHGAVVVVLVGAVEKGGTSSEIEVGEEVVVVEGAGAVVKPVEVLLGKESGLDISDTDEAVV